MSESLGSLRYLLELIKKISSEFRLYRQSVCVPTICVLRKTVNFYSHKNCRISHRHVNVLCNIFQYRLSKETGLNGQNGATALPNVMAVSRRGDVVVRSRRRSKLYRVPVVLRSGGCVILIYVKV